MRKKHIQKGLALLIAGLMAAGLVACTGEESSVASQPVSSAVVEEVEPVETEPENARGYRLDIPDMPEYGLADNVRLVTPIQYDYATTFYNGFAFVVLDNECGYVDEDSNYYHCYTAPDVDDMVDSFYEYLYSFESGLDVFPFTASEDGVAPYYDTEADAWGYMEIVTGEITVEAQYRAAYAFRDGLALVVMPDFEQRILRTDGEYHLQGVTVDHPFARNGAFEIIDDEKVILTGLSFSTEGFEVIPNRGESVSTVFGFADWSSYTSFVSYGDDNTALITYYPQAWRDNASYNYIPAYAYIDAQGNVLFDSYDGSGQAPDMFKTYTPFYEGYAVVGFGHTYTNDSGYSMVGELPGVEVINADFEQVTNWVTTPGEAYKYADAKHFEDGMLPVASGAGDMEIFGNLWGFVDTTFTEVIPTEYDDFWYFSGGYAPMHLPLTLWGVISAQNEEVIPFEYNAMTRISNGHLIARSMETNRFAVLTNEGKALSNAVFETSTSINSEGYVRVGLYEDDPYYAKYGILKIEW